MRTWRLLTLAAVVTGMMTGTVFSADTVKVFRYDGSLQCSMGQAVPLDAMAKELTAVNIRILLSEKRVVSGLVIALCGAPTGISEVEYPWSTKVWFKLLRTPTYMMGRGSAISITPFQFQKGSTR